MVNWKKTNKKNLALFLKHIIEAELILKLYKKRHTSDESKTLSWNKRQYIAPNLLQWFKKKNKKKKSKCVYYVWMASLKPTPQPHPLTLTI